MPRDTLHARFAALRAELDREREYTTQRRTCHTLEELDPVRENQALSSLFKLLRTCEDDSSATVRADAEAEIVELLANISPVSLLSPMQFFAHTLIYNAKETQEMQFRSEDLRDGTINSFLSLAIATNPIIARLIAERILAEFDTSMLQDTYLAQILGIIYLEDTSYIRQHFEYTEALGLEVMYSRLYELLSQNHAFRELVTADDEAKYGLTEVIHAELRKYSAWLQDVSEQDYGDRDTVAVVERPRLRNFLEECFFAKHQINSNAPTLDDIILVADLGLVHDDIFARMVLLNLIATYKREQMRIHANRSFLKTAEQEDKIRDLVFNIQIINGHLQDPEVFTIEDEDPTIVRMAKVSDRLAQEYRLKLQEELVTVRDMLKLSPTHGATGYPSIGGNSSESMAGRQRRLQQEASKRGKTMRFFKVRRISLPKITFFSTIRKATFLRS